MPRALLFTYYFPPSSAAGATRWDTFTRYAVNRGWEFWVVCGDAASAESYVPHPGVHIIRVPQPRSTLNAVNSTLVELKRRVRRSNSISSGASGSVSPVEETVVSRDDVRRTSVLSSLRESYNVLLNHSTHAAWARAALRAAEIHPILPSVDVVLSSGPPHMASVAASRFASTAGVPLVVDMRDPWAQMNVVQASFGSPLYFSLASKFERTVISASSLVAMNTIEATEVMRQSYPDRQFTTVRNGFDDTFGEHQRTKKFTMLYAGAIYLDRDPRPLLEAIGRLKPLLGLTPDAFLLRFIGDVADYGGVPLLDLARQHGIEDLVEVSSGRVARQELLQQMSSTAMLVNLPQGASLCIPSKLYEYLSAPSWLLAIEPEGTATRSILAQSDADVVAPNDVAGLSAIIRRRFLSYMKGATPSPTGRGADYSSSTQASALFETIERLLAQSE